MPKVSAIIPVWNSAATVAQAIDSVLGQTYADLEIIAVDDGSSDDSLRVLGKYGERVKVLAQINRGPSAARNAGARASRGEYLAFLDADDSWMPEMLARCAGVLDSDPGCVLVYTNAVVVDGEQSVLRDSTVPSERARAPSMEDLLGGIWPIVPSTTLMRRTAFDAVGGFAEPLRSCEDIFMWLLVRERGPFRYLPERLARKTESSMFPKVLERDAGAKAFERLVLERYGARARGLVRAFRLHKARLLANTGLQAMRDGRSRDARRCFLRALSYDPSRLKNYGRVVRTFLPRAIARAMTRGNSEEA